jgi:hypothetical protein
LGVYRQQGMLVQSKLQKTASFIVVESLDVKKEHLQVHSVRSLDTSERIALITFSCLFKHALLNIQSQTGIT